MDCGPVVKLASKVHEVSLKATTTPFLFFYFYFFFNYYKLTESRLIFIFTTRNQKIGLAFIFFLSALSDNYKKLRPSIDNNWC
ncbi:hypothetical protein C2G38_407552 [Gigaspora rosea]|uniref:Uncharacterized protein n=1 Tax=Gigaspora rosea TaxID=44941 RepID=A0A397VWV6_9GLOM|nr:hypothetical protein C2G38_407552 [Gigaspora rosea]